MLFNTQNCFKHGKVCFICKEKSTNSGVLIPVLLSVSGHIPEFLQTHIKQPTIWAQYQNLHKYTFDCVAVYIYVKSLFVTYLTRLYKLFYI